MRIKLRMTKDSSSEMINRVRVGVGHPRPSPQKNNLTHAKYPY